MYLHISGDPTLLQQDCGRRADKLHCEFVYMAKFVGDEIWDQAFEKILIKCIVLLFIKDFSIESAQNSMEAWNLQCYGYNVAKRTCEVENL